MTGDTTIRQERVARNQLYGQRTGTVNNVVPIRCAHSFQPTDVDRELAANHITTLADDVCEWCRGAGRWDDIRCWRCDGHGIASTIATPPADTGEAA